MRRRRMALAHRYGDSRRTARIGGSDRAEARSCDYGERGIIRAPAPELVDESDGSDRAMRGRVPALLDDRLQSRHLNHDRRLGALPHFLGSARVDGR